MHSITYVLSYSPLFKGLSVEYRQRLTEIGTEQRVEKGEILFFEGDECDGFYLVIEGQIKIYKLSADGKEKILHFFGVGEPVGEVAMFTGQAYPANAQAVERSRLLFFKKATFVRLIADSPSLSMNMMGILSRRLKRFAGQIEELSLKDVPARLAGYLVLLIEEQQNNRQVTLSITKGQLASLLGTIPETLSRILLRMNQLGYISVEGKAIKVLNEVKLRELVENGRFPDS
jgi:CRP/FNR family transcriptional regulator, dissimilatory nitrate respiration regulator